MGISRYWKSGRTEPYVEYDKQIDFRESAPRSNWRIVTFLLSAQSSNFTINLYERKLQNRFQITRNPFKSGLVQGITFTPYIMTADEASKARRNMLSFLYTRKLRMIWKEDNHGYEIDQSGNIKHKWVLNSIKPMSVSREPPPVLALRLPVPSLPLSTYD